MGGLEGGPRLELGSGEAGRGGGCVFLRWQSKAQCPPLKQALQIWSYLHGRMEQVLRLKCQHGSPL